MWKINIGFEMLELTKKQNLLLPYKQEVEYQNIDIEKLRPKRSYDYLIEHRNAALQELLNDEERLKEFLVYRSCPCCASEDFKFLYKKDSLDIVECRECGVIYVNPIFDEEKYLEIYQSHEYQEIVRRLGEESHEYRVERFGKERAEFIDKFHNRGLEKRFLDIGCSTGFVLEALQTLGWECVGLELNPSAVRFAQRRGLKVLNIPLEQFAPTQKFAAVGLFDVLEHLVNPRDILLRVRDLLYDGGNVFIYVPNYNSASKELLGVEHAHFIWPTHHLTYFTPITLRGFLENLGFEVFFWETQGLDLYDWLWFLEAKMNYDVEWLRRYAEPLQFYINAAGHGKNLRMFARKK